MSALADEVDRLLADADEALARDYPGEVAARQPVLLTSRSVLVLRRTSPASP